MGTDFDQSLAFQNYVDRRHRGNGERFFVPTRVLRKRSREASRGEQSHWGKSNAKGKVRHKGHISGIGRDISGQVRTVGLDRSVM